MTRLSMERTTPGLVLDFHRHLPDEFGLCFSKAGNAAILSGGALGLAFGIGGVFRKPHFKSFTWRHTYRLMRIGW